MSLASLRRARGVKAALAWVAWDTKASFGGGAVPRQLHSTPGGLRPSTDQTVSSQVLDQRAWTSQLEDRPARRQLDRGDATPEEHQQPIAVLAAKDTCVGGERRDDMVHDLVLV